MDEFFSTKVIKLFLLIALIMGVPMLIESHFVFSNSPEYKVLQDSIVSLYKAKNQDIEFGFFVGGDLNILDEKDSTYKSKLYFKIYNDFEKKSVVGVVFNKKETSINTIQSIMYED